MEAEDDAGLEGNDPGTVGLSAGSSVSTVHAQRPARAPAHRPGKWSESEFYPQVTGWLLHVVSLEVQFPPPPRGVVTHKTASNYKTPFEYSLQLTELSLPLPPDLWLAGRV